MIYKFEEPGTPIEMEVKKDNETYQSETVEVKVSFTSTKASQSIRLSKTDVYHLIGALHLLHKEMK